MPRLIDRIRAQGRLALPRWAQNLPTTDRNTVEAARLLADFLRGKPPVFVIDNVAEYLFAGTDQENWYYDRDFPCVKPPFPRSWFEYRQVTKIVSEKHGVIEAVNINAVGFAVENLTAEEAAPIIRADAHPQHVPSTEYLLLHLYFEPNEGQIIGPMGRWLLGMGAQGEIIAPYLVLPYVDAAFLTSEELERLRRHFGANLVGFLYPVLLALSFLNCRNISHEEWAPPPKLAKRYQERHPQAEPLVKYYTLTIDPFKETLAREGGAEAVGIARALHIVRGNFATYTPDRPLFGRTVGTFWRPMHKRGSADAGRIEKEYRVKGPRRP